jgi:N-acetyl-anhydromuramyl-L-alanine amidase AmpD
VSKLSEIEFSLMCGETAMQTIIASLEEYAPKLLQYIGYEVPESIGEKEMISVLEALDKSVRPSGPGAKAPAVWSAISVKNYSV